MPSLRLCALLPLLAALLAGALPAQEPEGPEARPWRLSRALSTPDWFRIGGSVRLRYEGLSGQFRSAGRLDSVDHVLFQRTRLRFDLSFDPAGLTLELQDSRHYGGSFGSAINTSSVNAVHILQGYASFDLGVLGPGEHELLAGRYTVDHGSRRLVARNRYRNTTNAFTGVSWRWTGEQTRAEAFWNLPVLREPRALDSILDNDVELDTQDLDRQFFGLFAEHDFEDGHQLAGYAYGLLEDTGNHRELGTLGARFRRPARRGAFDHEVEAALQFGASRLSSDGPGLDHLAWFAHVSLGYTFDAEWKPRLGVALDFASGDNDPTDGANDRFDTLFGARRFEYGPTGIYGAIGRGNLISPELRFTCRPQAAVQIMTAWRGIWLASEQDAWITARVQDPGGAAGRHVGQQVEFRVRYDVLRDSLRLEAGAAYLFKGAFQDDAPNGQGRDSLYGYVQMVFKF